MADMPRDTSPSTGGLFNGLKFWLSLKVPMRTRFKDDIIGRGGTVVALESEADMCIVDDTSKNLPVGQGYYSYKFLDQSIQKNALENPGDYLVGIKSAADRLVGSVTVAASGKRNQFTREDDQILFNWLQPFRLAGGKWKGNEIYKHLARKHPQHTFQSWRSRFLSVVAQAKMEITEQVDPYAQSEDDNDETDDRSLKRRRLNGRGSVNGYDAPTTPARLASTRLPTARDSSEPQQSYSPNLSATQPNGHVPKESNEELTVSGKKIKKNIFANPSVWQKSAPSSSVVVSATDKALEQVNEGDGFHGVNQDDEREPADESVKTQAKINTSADSHGESPDRDISKNLLSKIKPFTDSQHHKIILHQLGFSIKDAKQLYKAVPHIQNTKPHLLHASWAGVAAELGRHTPIEWQFCYENAILPEYMRRNKLETWDDLVNHVADMLVEEQIQGSLQEDAEVAGSSMSGPPAEEEEDIDKDRPQGEDTEMFYKDRSPSTASENSPDASTTSQTDASNRDPSPAAVQVTLKAVEVRQNDEVVAQHSVSSQSLPPGTQSSTTTPKKSLFGRTLDAEIISSQLQYTVDATEPSLHDQMRLESAPVANTLGSFASQSLSSSKQPPESGQRPPKSLTPSQEDAVISEPIGKQPTAFGNVVSTFLVNHQVIGDTGIMKLAPRDGSPVVNLFSDNVSETGKVPSSPGLSDTGSEYITFEDGPARSQLWDVSQDEVHDVSEEDDLLDDSDVVDRQIDQHRRVILDKQFSDTPRITHTLMAMQKPTASSENEHNDNMSQTESEPEGSLELNIEVPKMVKNLPRTETQTLFQQPLSEIEEDATVFDLPPPDGGWDQFSDLEEEHEDVRKSVELPDRDLFERTRSSLSLGTIESTTEESFENRMHLKVPTTNDTISMSSNESSLTISSGEQQTPISKRVEVSKQTPQSRSTLNQSAISISLPTTLTRRSDNAVFYNTENSSTTSEEQGAIESWFSRQPKNFSKINPRIVKRLASTALQATILNLPAATFTLRDMIASFEKSETDRKVRFHSDIQIKLKQIDDRSQTKFRPKTRLTEEEAKVFLPQNVLGVWTVKDDIDFLSRTTLGLQRVQQKHGHAGVRKRATFLRIRYGQEGLVAIETPATVKRRR